MYDHDDDCPLDISEPYRPLGASAADLEAELCAAGYVQGRPPWLRLDCFQADQRCYSRSQCPDCGGRRRQVRAWHKPGSYRLVLTCSCGTAEEA